MIFKTTAQQGCRLSGCGDNTIASLTSAARPHSHTSLSQMSEKKWLFRIVFLETVAGVPGE